MPAEQSNTASSSPKVFLTKKEGGTNVTFDGVPFTIEKETVYDCQYGKHYYKEKSLGKRLCLQGTRKIGCHAHIKVKEFNLYPNYKITSGTVSKRETKRLQEKRLSELRTALTTNDKDIGTTVNVVKKFFVSLPSDEAHSGHPVGKQSGFSQRIHPRLIQEIAQLVSAGITEKREVKRSLRYFVTNTLSKELGYVPQPSDRAMYPSDTDIHNHIHLARKALDLSKFDQENVQLKIKQWSVNTHSQFYFRPYIESKPREFEEKVEEGLNTTETSNHTLLYVHQEQWQKHLLERYGGTMALLDSTYKVTKYNIPLFFLCVRTNVGYSVVAEFVVQQETCECISEALAILKEWNPKWSPKFFMVDYSDAEILALETTFPTTQVYICDFHREQAWVRWVRDHKHGLTQEEGEQLLQLLRECAHAPPTDTFPHNILYKGAVQALMESPVWKNHESVQNWLTAHWLGIPQVNCVLNIIHVYICTHKNYICTTCTHTHNPFICL